MKKAAKNSQTWASEHIFFPWDGVWEPPLSIQLQRNTRSSGPQDLLPVTWGLAATPPSCQQPGGLLVFQDNKEKPGWDSEENRALAATGSQPTWSPVLWRPEATGRGIWKSGIVPARAELAYSIIFCLLWQCRATLFKVANSHCIHLYVTDLSASTRLSTVNYFSLCLKW